MKLQRYKIAPEETVIAICQQWKQIGETIILCNGCYGCLHPGHVYCLKEAAKLGDMLIVAINSDESYRIVKDRNPPISWDDRAMMIAELLCVDLVVKMTDITPNRLIKAIRPDILVKGATSEPPVGAEIVRGYGGKIHVVPAYGNYSTTGLLNAK